MKKIIADSSPLIAFLKKNEFTLLKDIFQQIFIPEAVYNELIEVSDKFLLEKRILQNACEEKWLVVKKIKKIVLKETGLGKGELEVIHLGLEDKNSILLLDDKKARRIARFNEINTLGTLGILYLIKKRRMRTIKDLKENLDTLIQQGFYLSSEIIIEFMKSLE